MCLWAGGFLACLFVIFKSMITPNIKIVRAYYRLLTENGERFGIFPEACIRGALGYLLMDWVVLYQQAGQSDSLEQTVRLYEALVGEFPNKIVENRTATPPKNGMLLVRCDGASCSEFLLELTFFGDYADLLPMFGEALKTLGMEGVGQAGVHYDVDSQVGVREGFLYDFVCDQIMPESANVALDFYTPTTLKAYGGIFLNVWSSDAFARNLWQRLNLLCSSQNVACSMPFTEQQFIDAFVTLKSFSSVEPVRRGRYSSRQKKKIDCSGFSGRVVLKDVPKIILTILLWGEIIAVGKNTTFGNGRYRLQLLD